MNKKRPFPFRKTAVLTFGSPSWTKFATPAWNGNAASFLMQKKMCPQIHRFYVKPLPSSCSR